MRFTPRTELELARMNYCNRDNLKFIYKNDFINNLKNRFYAKIIIPENEDSCMLWIGAKKRNGAGHMRVNKRNFAASRISYSIFIGKVPDNLDVLHKCDNPSCVKPDHLFLGTHQDNMVDRKNKNRDPMKKGQSYKYRYENSGEKHPLRKLTNDNVIEIRKMLSQGISQSKIAKFFVIDQSVISRINTNKTWRI